MREFKNKGSKARTANKNPQKTSKRWDHIPVKVGDIVDISIHGMGTNGEGVGRIQDFTVFVPFALPEEIVTVSITVVKKTYAVGNLVNIIQRAPHRIEPRCDLYGTCGGCQLQHVSYEGQLRLKTQKVRDVMERIGHVDGSRVLPAIGPKNPWNYRNKMQLPVGSNDNGQLQMGFYERGSHRIVQGTSCAIQKEGNNDIAQVCYDIARELGISPYDERTGSGILRHVVGRVSDDGWMVILVTATDTLPNQDQWVEALCQRLPSVTSIVQNINNRNTNVILGEKNNILWGDGTIIDSIKDLVFSISPHSFFQVNSEQTTVLYDQALAYADLQGDETVIDAYCGTGTISLFLAHKAKHVIGIEIVEPAIIDAKENALRNGFTNTEFIVGDAAIEMPKLYESGVRPDVIVFDPIRAGCKEEVLIAAAGMEPKRMVYVSCNPATMARDCAILANYGYEVKEVQPVDMFPMSSHVECVALMSRVEN